MTCYLVGEGDRSRGQPCSPGVPFGALPAPLRCSHCSWEHQSCSWEALWVRGEPWRGCCQDYTSSVGLWREAGRTAGMGVGRMQQAQAAEPGCAHCMQHPSRLYPCLVKGVHHVKDAALAPQTGAPKACLLLFKASGPHTGENRVVHQNAQLPTADWPSAAAPVQANSFKIRKSHTRPKHMLRPTCSHLAACTTSHCKPASDLAGKHSPTSHMPLHCRVHVQQQERPSPAGAT